jgi:hypothetical protein
MHTHTHAQTYMHTHTCTHTDEGKQGKDASPPSLLLAVLTYNRKSYVETQVTPPPPTVSPLSFRPCCVHLLSVPRLLYFSRIMSYSPLSRLHVCTSQRCNPLPPHLNPPLTSPQVHPVKQTVELTREQGYVHESCAVGFTFGCVTLCAVSCMLAAVCWLLRFGCLT